MSRFVSRAIIEVLVRDVLRRKGSIDDDPAREVEMVFDSDLALALKHEIVDVGRKLWERQYVDGNGGNISCRLTNEWVLCTPTLMSKGDLRVEDICMVDVEGKQLAGVRRRSSEILLHLAVMKAVPAARAVIHCHPPHATAYALAHAVPPDAMLAEHEVFIGPVALVPYETPGTQACADAVVPLATRHNTILMANHGVVTWADNLVHAEWFVEVMDTTCRVLMLAAQAGLKPQEIPPATVGGLLAIKRTLGLPDARFGADQPEAAMGTQEEVLVRTITDIVLRPRARERLTCDEPRRAAAVAPGSEGGVVEAQASTATRSEIVFRLLASVFCLLASYFFPSMSFPNPSSSVLKSRAACPTRVMRMLRIGSPFLSPCRWSAPAMTRPIAADFPSRLPFFCSVR